MDHAINAVRPYYNIVRSIFMEEWNTGEYGKISDCPSYEELKALAKAINVMSQYYDDGNWAETPKEIIDHVELCKGFLEEEMI